MQERFRQSVHETYDDEYITGGCFLYVNCNGSKAIESHEYFVVVVAATNTVVNNIFGTEAYGLMKHLLNISDNVAMGRPVSSNSLEWQGPVLKSNWVLKHRELLTSMMLKKETMKYFDKDTKKALLQNDELWDKMAIFRQFGNKFILNKKLLLR